MYNQKQLRFEITRDTGNGKSVNVSINNVKCNVHVNASGGQGGTQFDCALYGLSTELISLLSPATHRTTVYDPMGYLIKIFCGDVILFDGAVFNAYASMNEAPEMPFIMQGNAGIPLNSVILPPFSRPGTVRVSEILDSLCKLEGYTLNGVGLDGITETNPHYAGSLFNQLWGICQSHNLDYQIEGKLIHIWKYGTTIDDIMPFISPGHGLIGYPIFTDSGASFQAQYSPLLANGRYVSLETSLPGATGVYYLSGVEHYLSSWVEGGTWSSVCRGISQAIYENK